ncbi:MAG: hypothetical protein U0992_18940 [Planctomycetaceae bacterium]
MTFRTIRSAFALALVACVGMTCLAIAGNKSTNGGNRLPFKGCLDGILVSRTPIAPPVVFDHFEAEGHATHLGRCDIVIEATVNFGTQPVSGEGTYTFTAANGDVLVADFFGSSALVVPGLVLITEYCTVNPDDSTGQFAGAEGEFTVERLADAATGVNGETTGDFDGWISLRRGKKH